VQQESTSDKGRQHRHGSRHDVRQRPVRVVVEVVPVHGIPEAPKLGERSCREWPDEEVDPLGPSAGLAKPELQVLGEGEPVGYLTRSSRGRPPATRSPVR
jgi:hypothetical protein